IRNVIRRVSDAQICSTAIMQNGSRKRIKWNRYRLKKALEYLACIYALRRNGGAILVVWYLVLYFKWLRDIYYPMKSVPSVGALRLPILGTKYKFIGVPREELFNMGTEIIKTRGPIFCTWTGSSPELVICKPEYLEVILNNSTHITKGRHYKSLVPWLGQGLLTSTGARWFQHRKLITPTFHFKILENFMDVFVSKSQALLTILDAKANGTPFDIYPDITHCALDIICETAMGVSVNAMSNTHNEYVTSVYGISQIIVWRILRPYIVDSIFQFTAQGRAFKRHLNILHSFTRKVIAERKQCLKGKPNYNPKLTAEDEILGKKKKMSFLDLLLESSADGEVLSDQDIAEEVDTFMFEGHDTTTAGICWTLLLLGNHQKIQQKLYEEISSTLQEKSTPSTLADLNEMKYLENVIKESLRLYPSVPFIVRKLEQEVTIDKYRIPPGTQAILHIHGVHTSPDYYPEPNKFDPDRFLPENSQGRHPYAYIPFSAGPRNCIGQKFAMFEEKTLLASIVKKYKITATETQDTIKLIAELVLRPMNGIILKLEKRH
ncbi:cytochrome P450, partial [Oryctes borbonicus]